jgi:hypothetical protein
MVAEVCSAASAKEAEVGGSSEFSAHGHGLLCKTATIKDATRKCAIGQLHSRFILSSSCIEISASL